MGPSVAQLTMAMLYYWTESVSSPLATICRICYLNLSNFDQKIIIYRKLCFVNKVCLNFKADFTGFIVTAALLTYSRAS